MPAKKVVSPLNGKLVSVETAKYHRGIISVSDAFNSEGIAQQVPLIKWRNEQKTVWEYICFFLPMPPSLNDWVRIVNGRALSSPVATEYKKQSEKLLNKWKLQASLRKLEIYLELYGLPERSDTDNRQKQIQDSLQGSLCHNDYQFRKYTGEDMDTIEKDGSYVRLLLRTWEGPKGFADLL